MPPTFTYPGVYIEEIPSAVHTITGVATSIAAFIGWAAEGPTSQATLVQSWSDFAFQFGGLDSRSLLGYSVNQFFGNGGQQAYIVRLVAGDAVPGAVNVPASGGGNAFTPCMRPGGVVPSDADVLAAYQRDGTTFLTSLLSVGVRPVFALGERQHRRRIQHDRATHPRPRAPGRRSTHPPG